jgi:hypothetical protein
MSPWNSKRGALSGRMFYPAAPSYNNLPPRSLQLRAPSCETDCGRLLLLIPMTARMVFQAKERTGWYRICPNKNGDP